MGVKALVLPRLLYGSEAWFTGSTYGPGPALQKAEVTINRLLRKTLWLKDTTPTSGVQWEMGLEPITPTSKRNMIAGPTSWELLGMATS